MAANFQHMANAGGNSMMMQPQQPQGPGVVQLQQLLFRELQSQQPHTTGWQSNIGITERFQQVCQMVTQLRLVESHYDLTSICSMALKFEKASFETAQSKDFYLKTLKEKLEQLTAARTGMSVHHQQLVQAQRQAQLGMANQPGMNGQMARAGISQQQQQQQQIPQQQTQSPFHHLQHPMQASPLPSQQQQQQQQQQQHQLQQQQQMGMGMAMGMVNNSLPQNMPQPQQLQMNIQQQQQQTQGQQAQLVQPLQQPQQQPQQMPPNRPPGGQPTFTPQEQAIIGDMAQRMLNSATEEEKNTVRQTLRSKVDHAALLRYQNQGADPAIIFYRNQAIARLRAQKHLASQQAQGLQGNVNIPSATPMQPQRSGNANVMGGHGQGHGQQPQMVANQDFGNFPGNVENFIGKQSQGGVLAQQDASQMNAPTSLPQGSSTPQSLQGLPGQQPGGNGQRAVPTNPNLRAQQQQAFNAQQAQQERLNQTARANAQNEARKLGLQGQPGGMGPMPPQQSPAMSTLNTPLRTSQQNPADPQQINQPSATQFGQAIDPRFVQMGQHRTSQGPGANGMGVNGLAFPAGITQEQRQKLASMSKDKLNEVIGRWNASQAQAVKQQTPVSVQGVRPNQPVAHPGPFNPQAAQYVAGIQSGQPQQMLANITPQQQMLFRQQFATRNQQQSRLPNMPPGFPADPHTVSQFDQLEFPQQILNSHPILRQVPPEIKRWAELKQWVSQNPAAIQANILDPVKNYQRMQIQQMVRVKSQSLQQRQQQHQAGALPNAQAGNQAPTASVVPPGMAPIAPMGQNPINMSINQEDIQKARAHQSGRWASMSDEEIRQMINTHRQRMELQQRQMQLQLNQMSQSQSQQSVSQSSLPRSSVPQTPLMQQSVKQSNRSQPGPGVQPGQQQAQQQPPAADTVGVAPPTGRAGRTAQANRGAPQTSSPSQSQKNSLKRANSDDVVEVPNPNTQQVPQSTPQQPQNQRKPPQRGLTAQQLASLTPEKRQKYEQSITARQAKAAQGNTAQANMTQANTAQASRPQANTTQANTAQANAAQMNPAQANSALRASQADIQQCSKALEEEALKSEPFVAIPMTAEMRNTTSARLLNTGNKLRKVKQALPKWFAVTHDQARLRLFCRNYHKISQQFLDADMEKPKNTFSMRPDEIDQAYVLANHMMADVARQFPNLAPNLGKPSSGAGVPSATAPVKEGAPAPQPVPAQAVPLNAANLQQQQQALRQQNQIKHNRTNSRSQPPAAPTSAQPPFPIDSPLQGIPHQQLTQEQLRMPPAKKQKQSASSTPVLGNQNSATSTPLLKTSSPDSKNQQMEPPKEEKVILFCPEIYCDHHFVGGFEDEQALEKHKEEEHVNPLSNPPQFAQRELAIMLELEPDGTATKASNVSLGTMTATTSSQLGQASTVVTDGTPATTTITPMNRQASGAGTKNSPAASKGAKATKPDEVKNARPSEAAAPPPVAAVEDLWANSSVNPQDLLHNFQGLETGAGGAISDMSVYRSITPNDTPESSKDGTSEPPSDITEGLDLAINLEIFDTEWNPFGPGDTDDLLNLSKIHVNPEEEFLVYDENQHWSDFIDQSNFDKPFTFDTSGFSMNVE